jgi:addiction module HigA family antidote
MRSNSEPKHPGTVLNEEFLIRFGLSENRLALELRISVTRISAIVRGKRVITPDTALRLARYFKNEPEFWMVRQLRYDLDVAIQQHGHEIERDVRPREDDE